MAECEEALKKISRIERYGIGWVSLKETYDMEVVDIEIETCDFCGKEEALCIAFKTKTGKWLWACEECISKSV